MLSEGVFWERKSKIGRQGIVVCGEYGLTVALTKAGYTIDTLLAMHRGVDWRDEQNWQCNGNVHPSRHGTYDGISMSPYETVFLKASWSVGVPFADKYAGWLSRQLTGQPTAVGTYDREMYRYTIRHAPCRAVVTHDTARCPAALLPCFALESRLARLGIPGTAPGRRPCACVQSVS